jgi:hypothetical protein
MQLVSCPSTRLHSNTFSSSLYQSFCYSSLYPQSKISLSVSYSGCCPIQNFTDSELAEMPSCNLAETVRNKWLQQSGNHGNDLYVATADDFVRALMQVSRYYQYLKGELLGTGLGKEELMLRVAQHSAQRSRNPKVLNAAIAKMPGAAEFCTWEPHFEGEEVFGSQKCKVDVPLGSKHESHRPDKVNFSHLLVRIRSSSAKEASCTLNIIPEELFPDLQDG